MFPNIDMEQYRDEIVREIAAIVRIPSVKSTPEPGAPFGEGPHNALMYALELSRKLCLTVRDVDGYAGHAEWGSGDALNGEWGYVGVLNHLDVVPEGQDWSVPPYGGVIADGKIFGRGTSDNKGPAIVSLYCLKALMDANVALPRRVRVIFGTDEESGWGCMRRYFEDQPLPDYGFSPDAGYPMYNREKGIMVLKFTCAGELGRGISEAAGGVARNSVPDAATARVESASDILDVEDTKIIPDESGARVIASGIPAHGANPAAGKNAVITLLSALAPRINSERGMGAFLLSAIARDTTGAGLNIDSSDEPSGALTLNLGLLRKVKDGYEAYGDVRFPVTDDATRIAKAAALAAAKYGVTVEIEKYTPPLYVPADAPMLAALSRAYEETTGLKSELLSMGGGTYARVLNNRGVAFGPGFPGGPDTHGHQADEFIVIDDLMRHAQVCVRAMWELANME